MQIALSLFDYKLEEKGDISHLALTPNPTFDEEIS